MKKRILSGMRPTGKLHLGNYLGALVNWVKLQDEYECFFMIADWHALTDRTNTTRIASDAKDVLIDWLASGLDPARSTLFLQSHIKAHAELHLILSMNTPLAWLERCPSYKEKIVLGSETNYGLMGYPILQSADILIYKANKVPVGEDQLAHLEICREIARRFNHLYGRVFPEPGPLLSRTTKILGTDGVKKMGKSYHNYIALSDSPEVIRSKVRGMFTDPEKIYRGDSGHPDKCNVYSYHQTFGQPLGEDLELIYRQCQEGKLDCTKCKADLAEVLIQTLTPFRKKRKEIEAQEELLASILNKGREEANQVAEATMKSVREAMKMLY